MKNILIPTNLDPSSINVIINGIKLARIIQSSITIIHCYNNEWREKDNTNTISSKEEAIDGINNLLKSIELKDINIKVDALEGYAEDALVNYCNEQKPNLVLMGTKSTGETIKELLGSITYDVIAKVSIPVLTIPHNYKIDLIKIKNILFITNFSTCNYSSLHKIITLTDKINPTVKCVEFSTKDKKFDENVSNFITYCNETYRNSNITAEYITGKYFIETIQDFVENNDIDIIAITRHKRNFASSLFKPSKSKKILFNIKIPSLFFH